MERRKFVIGLGSLAAGGAAAIGTGAFDSVEADRTAEIDVAADEDAYLGLTGDNDFVTNNSDSGELTIDLGGPDDIDDGDGSGFNERAVTEVSEVFFIENQGTQDVDDLGFGSAGDYTVELELEDGDSTAEVTLEIDDGPLSLEPGEETSVDVTVDTTKDPSDPSGEEDVTIVAEVN